MSRRATRAGGAWSAQFGRIRLPWQPPVAAFHYLDPPMSPLLVLIVAVLATMYAGPIVRFATAPALAGAFLRLGVVLPGTRAFAGGGGGGGRGGGPPPPPRGAPPPPPPPFTFVFPPLL